MVGANELGFGGAFGVDFVLQLRFHFWCGVLHHEVVDFLGVFIPPFLLIVCMVVLPLPFRCFDKVGWIRWVFREDNGWLLEFANS